MKQELWHGAQNKFVLLFPRQELSFDKVKGLAKRFAVDGVICISKKKQVAMQFYNPDGTKDNCGNALRVTAMFAYKNKLKGRKGIIFSQGKSYAFTIRNSSSKVFFENPHKKNGIWSIGNVRHKICIVDSFCKAKQKAIKLRNKFKCNITLVKKLSTGIFAQTFEVGVENFTASCGTGAIAAALEVQENKVFMPGGLLQVRRERESVSLEGKVKRIEVSHES
ncbi:hypothetical protein HZA98_01060 [Candidatus Woesearchaeota archaeon]|nr:hypothetical protein [Candidatus Woesearchaeota archaeon]